MKNKFKVFALVLTGFIALVAAQRHAEACDKNGKKAKSSNVQGKLNKDAKQVAASEKKGAENVISGGGSDSALR